MTIEEKRIQIDRFCEVEGQRDCGKCPHGGNKFCTMNCLESADDDVITAWYNLFYGKEPNEDPAEPETPHIRDSGNRREFGTGAVRDIQEGKGRCDLMPLDVVAEDMSDEILQSIHDFTTNGNVEHLFNVLKHVPIVFRKNMPVRSEMYLEVAKHFEEGAKKYGEHN